jgi:methyl-accepting chemotaxis protein
MHTEIPPYVFVIFIAATAAGVLIQAGILLGMFLALIKMKKKIEDVIDEARVHLLPTIATSRTLVEDLGPKITAAVNDLAPKLKTISSNVVETTSLVRREAENIKGAVDEVVGRSRNQAARVDGLVTGTLNGVEHATTTIQNGVQIPIRKISGWVAGLKAGVDVLFHKKPKPFGAYAGEDNESTDGSMDPETDFVGTRYPPRS